jgi:hypothetical protein
MAIATSYTEAETKQFMETVLGDTAMKLGWSVGGDDFDEPTNEVLYVLDLADFSTITTQALVKKVRAVARVEAWRAAMYYTVHEASFSAGAPGTGQTSRADVHRHAKAMFEMAKAEMMESYPTLVPQEDREVTRTAIEYDEDYYANRGD